LEKSLTWVSIELHGCYRPQLYMEGVVLMKKLIVAMSLLLSTVSSLAAAENCNVEMAKSQWLKMEEADIIYGGGMIKNIPTFSQESFWNQASYSARVGLVKTFVCIIAGPGKVLTKARIVNRGGKTLADWDGVEQSLDVK
jgi:hypothetical protein